MTNCKKCNKQIVFLTTPKGRSMPVDFDSLNSEEKTRHDSNLQNFHARTFYVHGRHVSHFHTCPNAAEFSGKGK